MVKFSGITLSMLNNVYTTKNDYKLAENTSKLAQIWAYESNFAKNIVFKLVKNTTKNS